MSPCERESSRKLCVEGRYRVFLSFEHLLFLSHLLSVVEVIMSLSETLHVEILS